MTIAKNWFPLLPLQVKVLQMRLIFSSRIMTLMFCRVSLTNTQLIYYPWSHFKTWHNFNFMPFVCIGLSVLYVTMLCLFIFNLRNSKLFWRKKIAKYFSWIFTANIYVLWLLRFFQKAYSILLRLYNEYRYIFHKNIYRSFIVHFIRSIKYGYNIKPNVNKGHCNCILSTIKDEGQTWTLQNGICIFMKCFI